MNFKALICLLISGLIISCAQVEDKPEGQFQLSDRDYFYAKNNWFLTGRLAISNEENAVSASIAWQHQGNDDQIELSGPFGQGRVNIVISEFDLTINDGERIEHFQHDGNADDLVTRHLGVVVPFQALKYWVIGLVEPHTGYLATENGFLQESWDVQYLQMQLIGQDLLPRKVKIENDQAKLKLIIKQWEFPAQKN